MRILCVFALLLLGLAHKSPAGFAAVGEPGFVAAYQLPDGTAPDLCQPLTGQQTRHGQADCDACRLAASTILPEPPAFAAPAFPRNPFVRLLSLPAERPAMLERSQTARGPPSFLPA